MATVARLLPRHWDGRRLLQFLTGLALIALAFAVPSALAHTVPPAEAPVTVITTVDTPLPPGLPVTVAPAPGRAGLALEAGSTPDAGSATSAGSTDVRSPAGLPLGDLDSRRICVEARAAAGGPERRVHGDRGPPTA